MRFQDHFQFQKFAATTVIQKKIAMYIVVEKMEEFKIVCIGINRPSKRNCVNKTTADQLYEAFSDFENDESLNCAVLHGM